MKRIIAIAAALALLLGMLVSAHAQVTEFAELGLAFEMPVRGEDSLLRIATVGDDYSIGISVYYYNRDALTPLYNAAVEAMEGSDEQAKNEAVAAYQTAYDLHAAEYFTVLGVVNEGVSVLSFYYGIDENSVCLGTNNLCTYFLLPGDNSTLTNADRTQMENEREMAEAILKSLYVIDFDLEQENVSGEMTSISFNTVDMDGNEVTEELFSKAKLTVLNLWGTYCNPCIGEMPELAAWAKELPEEVQLVGLIIDVYADTDRTYATAQKIISRAGVEYVNLLNHSSFAPLLAGVVGVPTTMFFDENGQQVHEPVVGAYVVTYKAIVEAYLAQ